MAKTVTPRPMPTTGMPDRRDPPTTDLGMKTGVMTTKGTGSFNPGKPADGK